MQAMMFTASLQQRRVIVSEHTMQFLGAHHDDGHG